MTVVTFNFTMICYLMASLEYILYLVYRRPVISTLALATVVFGFVSHTVIIGLRSSETGHGPYTTSFEVFLFLSWVLVGIYFFANWRYKIKDLGSFVIPIVFLIFLYSAFLSREVVNFPESEFQVLLTLHRTLSILGYAAFALAFATGVMYLIQEQQVKTKKLGFMFFRMPPLEILDNLHTQVIAVGFPLFTLGFVTGSIWNVEMRGLSFFSWDVEKTWPLVIGWLIYLCVFIGRWTIGLRGKRAAQLSIFGFATVAMTLILHF